MEHPCQCCLRLVQQDYDRFSSGGILDKTGYYLIYDGILAEVKNDVLRDCIRGMSDNPLKIIETLKSHQCKDSDLDTIFKAFMKINELNRLYKGEEHETKLSDKNFKFIKQVVIRISKETLPNGKPLISSPSHWFYVFFMMVSINLFESNDYAGFVDVLEQIKEQGIEIPYFPNRHHLSHESGKVIGKKLNDLNFLGSPRPSIAKHKRSICTKVNEYIHELFYK